MNKRIKNLARCQIFLIVLSIFAFAFIIGDVKLVLGQEPRSNSPNPTDTNDKNGNGDKGPEKPDEPEKPGNPDEPEKPGLLEGIMGSALISGLMTAAAIGGMAYFVGGMFMDSDANAQALGLAVGAGLFTAEFLGSAEMAKAVGIDNGAIMTEGSGLVGLGVGIAIFVLMYKKEKMEMINFECLPWEAPVGGEFCEDCNDDEFRPCSEYRCRSLGQACRLTNEGTEDESCYWKHPDDVSSPTIETWEEALTEGHSYVPHATRPVDRGTKIVRDDSPDGCLKAFTPLEFGVLTNEPAQCKIDIVHTNKMEEMNYYMDGNNYFIYEHTQKMSLPSPDSINSGTPEINEDGIYDLYIRCKDENGNGDGEGNENVDEFVINFCVDPSPDTTPPVIVDTSIVSGSPVAFGIGEIAMEAYVNEPAECKWSIQNKNYEDMENEMSCSSNLIDINAEQLYPCSTILTGITDREENTYYFRCKDQPNQPDEERNFNSQSYPFSLFGTEELNILEALPNETITGNTEVVEVELYVKTDDGANEGAAACMFSPTGEEGSYVTMFDTDSFEHKQLLTLTSGNYDYYFRCVDAGGNFAEQNASFSVYVDNDAPEITRAYHDRDVLKIVTNENAECVYSLNSCNYVFEEGLIMLYDYRFDEDEINHMTEWKENTDYYIKCKDEYDNRPAPNDCSINLIAGSNI